MWALHDAMPAHVWAAVLLGAFAGLRVAEVWGLRVSDVDFMRGIVTPAGQYPPEQLKTETSRTSVPIASSTALQLAAHAGEWSGDTLLSLECGNQITPWALERAPSGRPGPASRRPAGFRFHDLRHYFASLLIASGTDVKIVQTRLRHASAKTTLDTYGHL